MNILLRISMRFIARLLLIGLSVWLISQFLPHVQFKEPSSAILFVLLLTLLNVFFKPILIIITIPITILTFGLFLIFINTIIILVADALMSSFNIDGFFWAFVFSLIVSFVSWVVDGLLSPKEEKEEE